MRKKKISHGDTEAQRKPKRFLWIIIEKSGIVAVIISPPPYDTDLNTVELAPHDCDVP